MSVFASSLERLGEESLGSLRAELNPLLLLLLVRLEPLEPFIFSVGHFSFSLSLSSMAWFVGFGVILSLWTPRDDPLFFIGRCGIDEVDELDDGLEVLLSETLSPGVAEHPFGCGIELIPWGEEERELFADDFDDPPRVPALLFAACTGVDLFVRSDWTVLRQAMPLDGPGIELVVSLVVVEADGVVDWVCTGLDRGTRDCFEVLDGSWVLTVSVSSFGGASVNALECPLMTFGNGDPAF